MTWLLSRRLGHLFSDSIAGFVQASRMALAGKNPTRFAPGRYKDELSLLGVGIKEMRAQIEERDDQLRKQREDLDLQVAARMAELQAQNATTHPGEDGRGTSLPRPK